MKPLVYADFHNADPAGRLRLTCAGTSADLARQGVRLSEGLALTLYTDDGGSADGLRVDGVVTFSDHERGWVAVVDWNAVTPSPRADSRNGFHRTADAPARPG